MDGSDCRCCRGRGVEVEVLLTKQTTDWKMNGLADGQFEQMDVIFATHVHWTKLHGESDSGPNGRSSFEMNQAESLGF